MRSLCRPLNSMFASFAHFGILSAENSRCLYADARMEIGAYVLLVASVLLAWLSDFILEAENQREGDISPVTFKPIQDEETIDDIFASLDESKSSKKYRLHPLPKQFSDKFGWFLTTIPIAKELEKL